MRAGPISAETAHFRIADRNDMKESGKTIAKQFKPFALTD